MSLWAVKQNDDVQSNRKDERQKIVKRKRWQLHWKDRIALKLWFKNVHGQDACVDGSLMCQKAKKLLKK